VAVRILIAAGADTRAPRAGCGRETPLWVACGSGGAACVQLLLDHGAVGDVTTSDAMGVTPLYCAADAGDAEVTRLLLHNGAAASLEVACRDDCFYEGCVSRTPLQVAKAKGHAAVAAALLAAGAKDLSPPPEA